MFCKHVPATSLGTVHYSCNKNSLFFFWLGDSLYVRQRFGHLLFPSVHVAETACVYLLNMSSLGSETLFLGNGNCKLMNEASLFKLLFKMISHLETC